MAKNIEMQYYNGSEYEVCYPKVSLSNITGALNVNYLSGVLPVSKGGTGATSIEAIKQSWGFLNSEDIKDLDVGSFYTYGKDDIEAGVTSLEVGKLYLVYEVIE